MFKAALALALLFTVNAEAAFLTFRNVYTVTPVTTSTPLVVSASLPAAVRHISIFDSSGQTMKLLVNGSLAVLIPPGGGEFDVGINGTSAVSLQAVTATASGGEIDINFSL